MKNKKNLPEVGRDNQLAKPSYSTFFGLFLLHSQRHLHDKKSNQSVAVQSKSRYSKTCLDFW